MDTAAAQALIDERSRELPPALRRRLISEAAGNPLALIELPRALADPELHLAGASSAALPLT
ncbi:MAG TPA: hypothetical protein VMU39_16990, partial [Solirubrobacteraceae bacterium]|nr:hypothetical protein [Solirubrobacteraceae bacterium]